MLYSLYYCLRLYWKEHCSLVAFYSMTFLNLCGQEGLRQLDTHEAYLIPDSVTLNEEHSWSELIFIYDDLFILEDTSCNLNVEDVFQSSTSTSFKRNDTEQKGTDPTICYWAKLTFQANELDNQEYAVGLPNYFDLIELYELSPGGIKKIFIGGHQFRNPKAEREYYVMTLKLRPNEQKTWYARLKPSSRFDYSNATQKEIGFNAISFNIMSLKPAEEANNFIRLNMLIFAGVFLFFGIYHLILAIITQNRSYLFFTITLFSAIFYINRFYFLYRFFSAYWVLVFWAPIIFGIFYLSLLSFMKEQLRSLAAPNPRFHWYGYVQLSTIVYVAFLLIREFGIQQFGIYSFDKPDFDRRFFMEWIIILFLLFSVFDLNRRGFKFARPYIIAFGLLLVFQVLPMLLGVFGGLETYMVGSILPGLGICLMVLMNAITLGLSFVAWRTQIQQKKLEEASLLNQRLQQVNKLKDQFLANTSHELRTPLQGIIGISESLYDEAEHLTPEKLRENLAMTISSGKRLNNLVNDILDFSKLKNSDIELLRKPINLYVLADIVLRNNSPLTKGKDLVLVNNIPVDLPSIDGDENRLQQVLYNLIGNAIKFTVTGSVTISAEPKGAQIQVAVRDTGIGIPENKRGVIFQEFEQGDGSISREFAGTGLGLSISKKLVELHSGKMWVESERGKGSTFFFTLPISSKKATTLVPEQFKRTISTSPQAKEPIVDKGPTIEKEAGQINILVVDDESINQQVFKNHLSGLNFQLTQVMDGEEAIKALEEHLHFDLVLLDVMMPRMSGYEVCQRIRENYLPSELPVIMITAKNQLEDIVQGLSVGANDYLPKPFHKEELLARIKTQIDLHHIFNVAGRFVPNEFLRFLNRDRITEVMLGDYTEREVTVLFLDIRDYTSLAETMTPEQCFKFVNAFHGRMGPIIKEHGGFINQFLGDAIMAIFPNKPENALRAAIAMQKQLTNYNVERHASGRTVIRIGVGLHTGALIMGIIGDQKRMDAATIADTVNTASRIESLTKYYGSSILLSENSLTQMLEETTFQVRYLGKVQVKGKKEPIGLYECFDGDALDTLTLKIKTQPNFQKGLDQFFNREFAQATAIFDQILKVHPEDRAARLFMTKASEYLIHGVPDKWDGVEKMGFK